MEKKSVLDVEVSSFTNYFSTDPQLANLLQWLQDDMYKDKVAEIRATEDNEQRKKKKEILPAITVSGSFTKRSKEDLIAHSGLICIDIDEKDNKHLGNFHEVKTVLAKAPFVAYCSLSVSGKGHYVIIPLQYPEKHEQHFAALQKLFQALKINIDTSCKDVCRLRGYSWDSEAYINHNATPFAYMVDDKEQGPPFEKETNNRAKGDSTIAKVEACIKEIKARCIDITDEYDKWTKVGFAFASQFNEAGRQYFHDVSRYYAKYNYAETDEKYTSLLKSNTGKVSIGSFIHLCKAHGIKC